MFQTLAAQAPPPVEGMEVDFPVTQDELWLQNHTPSPQITFVMLQTALRRIPLPEYLYNQMEGPLRQYEALCQRNDVASATQLRVSLLSAVGL